MILRKTQLRMSQKISLGALLCLSVAMMAIACTRLSWIRGHSDTYLYFWQYVEACVACIMASLLSFRTLFVSRGTRVFKRQELAPWPSMKQRVWNNMQIFNMAAWEKVENEREQLPEIPSATVSGLRTFIRRYHRAPGSTTVENSEIDHTDQSC